MGHLSIIAADIRRYAKCARLVVDEEDIEGHSEGIETQDEILSKLDELDFQSLPDRDYWSPDKNADPYAAFLRRCNIQRTRGPTTKRTVAVKDNIDVAGIPMTCGSPFMGNFVPPARRDYRRQAT